MHECETTNSNRPKRIHSEPRIKNPRAKRDPCQSRAKSRQLSQACAECSNHQAPSSYGPRMRPKANVEPAISAQGNRTGMENDTNEQMHMKPVQTRCRINPIQSIQAPKQNRAQIYAKTGPNKRNRNRGSNESGGPGGKSACYKTNFIPGPLHNDKETLSNEPRPITAR